MDKQQMTFNGVDFAAAMRTKGYKFSVETIEGRGVLSNNVSSRPIPGADGELFLDKSLPARDISVSYNLITNSAEDLRKAERELFRLLQVDKPAQLRFEDQKGYFEGIHGGIDTNYEYRGTQKGTIVFECKRPFLFHSYITYKDFVFAVNETQSFQILTNYKVLPILEFTITGAQTSFAMTVNGRELKYTGAIPTGAKIAIDGEKKELRINGTLKVLEVSGWFPVMIGGANTVKTSTSGTLTLKYQERYV